MSVGGY